MSSCGEPGLERAADHRAALGDEDALLGLEQPAQARLPQPHVVGQPRVVGGLDRDHSGHAEILGTPARSPGRARGLG